MDEPAARPSRRQGQDPVKRSQIIEGARRVFIDKGFEAASMNDITRAAGVSKGTIYVYFANKEELFEALIEEERGAIFDDLYDGARAGGDLRETLIRFGVALVTQDHVGQGRPGAAHGHRRLRADARTRRAVL